MQMKKLIFKENKFSNNYLKSEFFPNQDNLNQNKIERGRKMISRKFSERSTNQTGNLLKSPDEKNKCESKNKKSKKIKLTNKMKRFIKKKIKESKKLKHNFITVEEERESSDSDSDSFYEFKKRKILYDYEKEFLNRQNLNFMDLESIEENKENSEFSFELNFENEEILHEEIEKILLEVYKQNMSNNFESSENFLPNHEKNV